MPIHTQEEESLRQVLARLVDKAGAEFAMIVARRGDLLGEAGRAVGVEPRAVAALAAATHAATMELAHKVGEEGFDVVLHQGKARHVHTSTIDDDHIVVILFADVHNVGRVRFAASSHRASLAEALRRDRDRARHDMDGFRARAARMLDDAFSGYLKG